MDILTSFIASILIAAVQVISTAHLPEDPKHYVKQETTSTPDKQETTPEPIPAK